MDNNMDMEWKFGLTDLNMKGAMKMVEKMVRALYILQMDQNIQEHF